MRQDKPIRFYNNICSSQLRCFCHGGQHVVIGYYDYNKVKGSSIEAYKEGFYNILYDGEAYNCKHNHDFNRVCFVQAIDSTLYIGLEE